MINATITKNESLIHEIITIPEVFKGSYGQNTTVNEYNVDMTYNYLLLSNESKIVGLYQFKDFTNTVGEVHVHILPEFWGTGTSIEAGQVALEWARLHTPYRQVMGYIAANNMHSLKYAERLGYIMCGTIPKGIRYHDMVTTLILVIKEITR